MDEVKQNKCLILLYSGFQIANASLKNAGYQRIEKNKGGGFGVLAYMHSGREVVFSMGKGREAGVVELVQDPVSHALIAVIRGPQNVSILITRKRSGEDSGQ